MKATLSQVLNKYELRNLTMTGVSPHQELQSLTAKELFSLWPHVISFDKGNCEFVVCDVFEVLARRAVNFGLDIF
jgi:hypothetical protein